MSPHLVTGLQPSTQYTTPSRYRTPLSITNYLLVLRWNDYVCSRVYNKLPVGVEVE